MSKTTKGGRGRKVEAEKRDIYAEVTETVAAQLETILAGIAAGTMPAWTCPWSRAGVAVDLPYNAGTRRRYNGVNVFLLWLAAQDKGYASAAWLTFNQAREMGGSVRKGEKGTLVTLWRPLMIAQKDANGAPLMKDGKPIKKQILMLKHFTVFNVEQCDGIDLAKFAPAPVTDLPGGFVANDEIEAWIKGTGAAIVEHGASAHYSPTGDRITLPTRERFEDAGAFYATATHELGHWTGHTSRLARDLGKRFGSDAYAAEELVAEMASAFACASLGIAGRLQHAEYLAHWVRVLRADHKAIFTAASAARAAFEYLEDAVAKSRGEAIAPRASDEDDSSDDGDSAEHNAAA